jgi:regulatory protein
MNAEIYKKATQLCSRKEYSKYKMLTVIQKWNIEMEEALEVLKKLEEEKFIDEVRFAKAFARDKCKFGKWGKYKIRHALQEEKMNSELISDALDSIDESEYEEIIKNEIIKKAKMFKKESLIQKKTKLFQFTQSRGYEYDICTKLIDSFLSKS